MKLTKGLIAFILLVTVVSCTSSKRLGEEDEFATDDIAATSSEPTPDTSTSDISEFDLTEAATEAPAEAAPAKDEFADFDTAAAEPAAPVETKDEFADFDTGGAAPPAGEELALTDTPPVDIPPAIDTPPPTDIAAPIDTPPPPTDPVITDANEPAPVAKIKAVNYKSNKSGGTVVIVGDRPLEFTTRLNAETNQLIIEVKNSVVPNVLKRPLNTKDMSSAIGSIDVYQKNNSSVARFVVQLRPGAPEPLVQPEGDSLLIIGAATGVAKNSGAEKAPEGELASEAGLEGFIDLSMTGVMGSKALEQFLVGNQRYYGKKISIETNNLDIREALKFIAEESGINLLLDEAVQGNVSVKLRQVPWDQALILLLRSKKLGYMRQGNILRIARMEDLHEEELAAYELLEKRRSSEPLVVKRFFVNYLKLSELEVKIRDFMRATEQIKNDSNDFSSGSDDAPAPTSAAAAAPAPQPGQPAAFVQPVIVGSAPPPSSSGSSSSSTSTRDPYKGRVITDERTSSMIVTDTPSNLVKISKLIASLDVQPRQIMVEARTISASENFTKSLGINWRSTPSAADPFRIQLGLNSGNSTGNNVNTTFTWANLDVIGNLDAVIQLGEQQDNARTLTTTRTIILSGQSVPIDATQNNRIKKTGSVTGTGGTQVTEEFDNIKTGLSGSITPQASNKGTIISDISLDQSTLTDPVTGSTSTQKSGGKVISKSGQTVVVSAYFSNGSQNVTSGIPGLKDIPILGNLFKGRSTINNKFEQMVFSTQTILDPVEDDVDILGQAKPTEEVINE